MLKSAITVLTFSLHNDIGVFNCCDKDNYDVTMNNYFFTNDCPVVTMLPDLAHIEATRLCVSSGVAVSNLI